MARGTLALPPETMAIRLTECFEKLGFALDDMKPLLVA